MIPNPLNIAKFTKINKVHVQSFECKNGNEGTCKPN